MIFNYYDVIWYIQFVNYFSKNTYHSLIFYGFWQSNWDSWLSYSLGLMRLLSAPCLWVSPAIIVSAVTFLPVSALFRYEFECQHSARWFAALNLLFNCPSHPFTSWSNSSNSLRATLFHLLFCSLISLWQFLYLDSLVLWTTLFDLAHCLALAPVVGVLFSQNLKEIFTYLTMSTIYYTIKYLPS